MRILEGSDLEKDALNAFHHDADAAGALRDGAEAILLDVFYVENRLVSGGEHRR